MLWIKTQDEKKLINVLYINVGGKTIEGVKGSGSFDNFNLGKYESNDRALEILNEIFIKMEKSTSFYVTFDMPQN